MTDRTRRQVAQLRELASLGQWQSSAARLLRMHVTRVGALAKRYGIEFPAKPSMSSPFHLALREGFAKGLTPKQLAEATGKSPDVVAATLCKMGLTANRRHDPARYMRGFDVPDHLFARYKELRRLGLTFAECGYELGLLTRPEPRRLAA